MTVFRGYLKTIKHNLAILLSYTLIFVILCVMLSRLIPPSEKKAFTTTSLDITVIDNDGSQVSHTLIDYLSADNDVTLSEGNKGDLIHLLYIRDTNYVLIIPAGFSESLKLESTAVPGSTAGYYLDNCVNMFLHTVKAYRAAGYSEPEASAHALETSNAKADVERASTSHVTIYESEYYAYTFRYFPYLYISAMIYSVGGVLRAYRDRGIRARMSASPVSALSQTMQSITAFGLLFVIFWAFSLALPLIARGEAFYGSAFMWYFVINTFAMLTVAISIAFLVGAVAKSDDAISALTNVIGLGMCFLCGVFVPLNLLGSGVTKISRFLPVYWYERVNDMLGSMSLQSVFTDADSRLFRQSLAIQFTFAACIICIALVISKRKHDLAT